MTEALRVRKRMVVGGLLAAVQIWGFSAAFAGPWEDGMAAYNRGDYLPAMRLFRPLADRGNTKAQNLLGVMYRKGQGVTRNSVRAFVWFSRAAARGDARAKVELHEVSQTMTAQEMSEAEAMARACEASNYRSCEY
jgi:TPR repeat protein